MVLPHVICLEGDLTGRDDRPKDVRGMFSPIERVGLPGHDVVDRGVISHDYHSIRSARLASVYLRMEETEPDLRDHAQLHRTLIHKPAEPTGLLKAFRYTRDVPEDGRWIGPCRYSRDSSGGE